MRRAPPGISLRRLIALIAGAVLGEACLADYLWQLPPGFPQPRVPADNPMSEAKVALGCRLFFENRLSATGAYSCASCHRPEKAFTDGRERAIGATGDQVRRNTMTLTNVAYNAAYTWADDRLPTLEAQMEQPLFNQHPVEMGLRKDAAAPSFLAADERYSAAFRESFPGDAHPVSMANAIKAIAAFERTLISGRSAFDRYVFDDQRDALTESAKRGMSLFFSERGGCVKCHSGVSFSGRIVHRSKDDTQPPAADFANTGLYNVDGKGAYPPSDPGLIEATQRPQDMGKFHVPTLRNIALTAPYMHDGSVATLAAVVDHYVQGGRQAPLGAAAANAYRDTNIRPLQLTEADKKDLVAFLESLTDPQFVEAARPAGSCPRR